ncbi:hypothetical protein [Mesorhizobium delmotii]|uniref:hypothetical protein n=1 Tax=Mesorhizobium delmotii TaxID=1631247 RepID=UPI000F43C75D|nr:hypothetical protein [Mesorhizobium delmotii]
MKRVCLAALFVTAALSAHADGERWSMIPACERAVRIVSAVRSVFGYRLLHAEEDFGARIATIEYATRDDHGTLVHHSARCSFWHRRLSTMSIDGDVEGHIIVD